MLCIYCESFLQETVCAWNSKRRVLVDNFDYVHIGEMSIRQF